MLRLIREMCCDFIETIKEIKKNPIGNLSLLIPVAMFLIVFVTGIVSYVMFIVKGGYTAQINSVKESGIFEGYAERYTLGTVKMIFNETIIKIVVVLVAITFILMMVNFFLYNGKVKNVIMIADLILLVTQGKLFVEVFQYFLMGVCNSKENIYDKFAVFEQSGLNLKMFFVVLVVALVVFITYIAFLVTTDECEAIIKRTLESLLASYGIVPLVFLFLENIIALATSVFAIILVVICVCIVFWILASESGESVSAQGSSSSHASSSSSGRSQGASDYNLVSGAKKKDKEKQPNKKEQQKKNCAYIVDFNKVLGIKLFKVHGFMGDYIELDNGVVSRKVCSLEDYNKGKFHIYESETGREIKSNEIPWRK